MWTKWIAVLGCAALSVAEADRLVLKDGRELIGNVVRDGDRIRLVGRFGEVVFSPDDVAAIIDELTPWERWDLNVGNQVPGDLAKMKRLIALAKELRIKGDVEQVIEVGTRPDAVDPADPLLIEVADMLRTRNKRGDFKRYIQLLIRGANAQPEARARLEKLDYHFHEGEWMAPSVYYPKIGYVRFELNWYPPHKIPVLRAKRSLHNARRRVGRLASREEDARTSLARARRRAGNAASSAAQAEAAIAARADALSASERDLDRAQQALAQAQADRSALAASPLGCQPPVDPNCSSPQARVQLERYRRAQRERESELDRLRRRVNRERNRLQQVERQRQYALSELQTARSRVADYEASRRDAEARVLSAQDELLQLPASLAQARAELRQAEQDLAAAERAEHAFEAQ